MRILADLPDDDIKWLDARAAELGKSRAALLREAVSAWRAGERDWLDHGFGLWTRYGKGIDGGEYETAIRAQWARRETGEAARGGQGDDPGDAAGDDTGGGTGA